MTPSSRQTVLRKFMALKTELIDQAVALDRQRRHDAADVAIATAHRIGEICDEMQAALPAKRVLRSRSRRAGS